MDKLKTYTVLEVACGNCGQHEYSIKIPIGEKVGRHLSDRMCKNCGCYNTLEKVR